MTRSIKSTAIAAVLSAGLLSGCSAGQIAQTAQVEPGVPGINTQAPGRKVYLRNATVDYLGPKGYPAGANAPLSLWLFNNTAEPVTLTGVDGPAQVVLSNGANTKAPCVVPHSLPPAAPTSTAPSSAPPSPNTSASAPASAPASASASAKPSGSVKPSVAASPSASLSAPPSPRQLGTTSIKLTIPALGCVELSRRAAQYLQVVNLPATLDNTGTVASVLHFTDSTGQSFTIGAKNAPLQIPVAVPESPLPRSS